MNLARENLELAEQVGHVRVCMTIMWNMWMTRMTSRRRGHEPSVFCFAECGYSLIGVMGAHRSIMFGHLILTFFAPTPVLIMITHLGPPVFLAENRGLWVLLVLVRVVHACLWLILNMHARILLCVLRMTRRAV